MQNLTSGGNLKSKFPTTAPNRLSKDKHLFSASSGIQGQKPLKEPMRANLALITAITQNFKSGDISEAAKFNLELNLEKFSS